MIVHITVSTSEYLKFEFNNISFVPNIGETMIINNRGQYIDLTITNRELHIDMSEKQIVYLTAKENG